MTAIATYHRSVSEADMRTAIIEAVQFRGGRVFYIRDSRAAPETADLPDLIILLPDRGVVVFAELKSIKRKLTPGQAEVIAMLQECDQVTAMVVRPEPKAGEWGYGELMDWLEGRAS